MHEPRLVTFNYTDKKENQIFLIYKEIQSEAVAKSYMRKGFLIYEEMRKYFCIYEEALQLLHSEFPYIWGKFDFFISVVLVAPVKVRAAHIFSRI